MGTKPPIGDFVVTHFWSSFGDLEPMAITYGIHGNSPGNTAETVANEVGNLWVIAGLSAPETIAVGWSYDGYTVTEYAAEGTIVVERPAAVVGTKAGGTLPPNNAMLVKKQTGSGGRRNRGRFYLPAAYLTEGLVDNNGMIDNTHRGEREDAWQAYHAALTSQDLVMVVHHELAPFTGTVVLLLTIDSRIATQRRRLR